MKIRDNLLAFTLALAVPLCTWAQTEIEPNNGSTQATALTYNTAMNGSTGACSPTDNSADYFSFTPLTQGELRVQTSMSNSGPTNLQVTYHVRNNGTSVIGTFTLTAGANGVPVNDSFVFSCQGKGLYYISIENPSTTVCTNYTLTYDMVAPIFADDAEPNNGSSTAVTAAPAAWHQGQIDFQYGDNSDYYRIDLPTQGVLNIEWEAEHAGATTPATATLALRSNGTNVIQTWDMPVGANSTLATGSVSIDCRSNTGYYYLSLSTGICGTSYRFRYTVTPPFFANDAEPNDGSTTAIVLPHSTPTDGQINFSTYNENTDYYRLDLPSNGVLNINWQAEQASATPGTATIALRSIGTNVIQTWTVPVGASSIPVSQTVSLDCRSNTNFYYLSVSGVSCGISYRLSYTVTPPIFANDVEPNDGSTTAIVLPYNTPTDGQINFSSYVENSDYYRLDLPNNGVLNINWQAEQASATPGTATINLRSTGTNVIQTWTVAVGANSIPVSEVMGINCRGNTNFYYLSVAGVSCGVSYRLSYTVTPPIYAISPATGTGSTTATLIRLDSAAVQGQVNFYYGQTNAYYKVMHTGGPIVLSALAEHAGALPADYNVLLRSSGTNLLQIETRSAGGASTPLAATIDFGTRAAGTYYIEVASAPCGMSFALNCNDDDNDGVCNYYDLCINTPSGEGVNTDGCSCSQVTVDDGDVCTLDACLNGDVTNIFQDADNDLTCDANDGCPNDPNKIAPGVCGCGVSDADTDGDGTVDCNDGCPNDPNKIAPGQCGCGVSDVDTDGDLIADCNDGCPNDPNKIAPGNCGCGNPEPGTTCDDGNSATINDVIGSNCQCAGTLLGSDCEGVPGGTALPATACNDNNACTTGDVYDANCQCAGTFADADGDGTCDANDLCPGGPEPGTACDDGNSTTINDVIGSNCQCAGTLLGSDCEGVPGGPALPGTACDDNNACTTGDVYDANCQCAGTFADADNDGTCDADDLCANGPEPGTACDDGDVNTENDMVDANCNCTGDPIAPCYGEKLVLTFTLDNFGSQTTWEIRTANEATVVANGGPYADGPAGTTISETMCVAQGCYKLRVYDANGDGIFNGGYVLRDGSSNRIIDANGDFTDESFMGRKFCLPLSATELLPDYCDVESATGANFIQCTPIAGASAYQFWIFDPHGNNEWNFVRTNPMLGPAPMANIPQGLNANVRVRALVNGEYLPFGPACRLSTAGQPQLHQRGANGTVASKGEFQAWPNPTNGERLSITLTGADEAADQAEVLLFDATGRQAFAATLSMANGTLGTVLDLGNIGSGVYLLRITAGNGTYESRVLVVND